MSPTSYRTAPPRDANNPNTTSRVPPLQGPWSEAPRKAARMTLAARIPKVHLHCHLEGSLRSTTFVELASAYSVPLRYHPRAGETNAWVDSQRPDVDPSQPYRFKDFGEFLLTFA